MELGYRDDNPAAEISTRVSGYSAKPRERVLTDTEITMVMQSVHDNAPMLRFLLLTGLRIGEAQNGHLDGDYWIVPAEYSKNGRAHWAYLTKTARAQLPLPKCSATNIQSWLKRRCGKFGIDPAFTPHDARRTFSTRLHDAGVPPHVVEKCLNHTMQGVMAAYNQAEYRGERIAAYERMESLVLDVFRRGWLMAKTFLMQLVTGYRRNDRSAYEFNGNTLHVWRAIDYCTRRDLELPAWVRSYLQESARGLLTLDVPDPKKAPQQIAAAIGLRGKYFKMLRDFNKRVNASLLVGMLLDANPDRNITDIYGEVAEAFCVEECTVRDWCNARGEPCGLRNNTLFLSGSV